MSVGSPDIENLGNYHLDSTAIGRIFDGRFLCNPLEIFPRDESLVDCHCNLSCCTDLACHLVAISTSYTFKHRAA